MASRSNLSYSNRKKMQYLYLLKPKGEPNDLDSQYIGITYDPISRLKTHRGLGTYKPTQNPAIRKARETSGLEMVILYKHPSRSAISDIEKALRPRKNMGWNIAVGGEKRPRKATDADRAWRSKGRKKINDILRDIRKNHQRVEKRSNKWVIGLLLTALVGLYHILK